MKLAGASVLVTGASGGIGNAIARALHARGASVRLTARRAEVLESLRDELGERAEVLTADLSDPAEVAGLVERAGEIDVLVANAGLPGAGLLDSFSSEEIDRAIDVNLRAPTHLAHALIPRMKERGRGHLVFISSVGGKVVPPGSSLYSATKFGLRALALGLRQDLHGTGVGVTTVFPGFIRGAGMFADTEVTLPRRAGGTKTPEQVAKAVVRGIERDRAEIDVAPFSLRVATALGAVTPRLAARVQRLAGAEELSEEIARGHVRAGKR